LSFSLTNWADILVGTLCQQRGLEPAPTDETASLEAPEAEEDDDSEEETILGQTAVLSLTRASVTSMLNNPRNCNPRTSCYRLEVLGDIVSLANGRGGYLIIGIQDDGAGRPLPQR